VRRRFGVLGSVLVADQLLPGAGAGAGQSGKQRLQAGFRRSFDVEGSQTGQGGGAVGQGQNCTRSARRRDLRSVRSTRSGNIRFLRDHQLRSRAIGEELTAIVVFRRVPAPWTARVVGAVPQLAARADGADWLRRLRDAALLDENGIAL